MARVGTTRTTSKVKSKDIFEAEWPKRPSTNATPPPPDGLPNAKTLDYLSYPERDKSWFDTVQ